ncbi:MAG: hypothetical protein FWC16_06230 [Defluviitaleaceae bacterium]|nr:hypothetical protein [Defluviitaleaceae bacterium]MCL2274506.1 hypothetical protein [Defluviitaleaceae bacterium]
MSKSICIKYCTVPTGIEKNYFLLILLDINDFELYKEKVVSYMRKKLKEPIIILSKYNDWRIDRCEEKIECFSWPNSCDKLPLTIQDILYSIIYPHNGLDGLKLLPWSESIIQEEELLC